MPKFLLADLPDKYRLQVERQLAKPSFEQTHKVENRRTWALSELQKLQDDPLASKADHDQAGESKVDGTSGGEFRVSVTLRISDARDRDNDGAFSTLADCLVAAIGRLAEMDARTLRKHAAGFKRPRRGGLSNRKD